jgi:hypothetical protein
MEPLVWTHKEAEYLASTCELGVRFFIEGNAVATISQRNVEKLMHNSPLNLPEASRQIPSSRFPIVTGKTSNRRNALAFVVDNLGTEQCLSR